MDRPERPTSTEVSLRGKMQQIKCQGGVGRTKGKTKKKKSNPAGRHRGSGKECQGQTAGQGGGATGNFVHNQNPYFTFLRIKTGGWQTPAVTAHQVCTTAKTHKRSTRKVWPRTTQKQTRAGGFGGGKACRQAKQEKQFQEKWVKKQALVTSCWHAPKRGFHTVSPWTKETKCAVWEQLQGRTVACKHLDQKTQG